jgi:hypothetical protein
VGLFRCLCGQAFRGIECSADSRHPRPAPGARMPHALAVAPDWVALLAYEHGLPGGEQVLDPSWLGIGRTPAACPAFAITRSSLLRLSLSTSGRRISMTQVHSRVPSTGGWPARHWRNRVVVTVFAANWPILTNARSALTIGQERGGRDARFAATRSAGRLHPRRRAILPLRPRRAVGEGYELHRPVGRHRRCVDRRHLASAL